MSNYLLQTGRAGGASKRLTVKRATLVDHRTYVLRTNWLERTRDLVDVLTIISELVVEVVAVVRPFQFTHRELRSETEGAFTDIRLRNQTLEAFAGHDEENFIGSGNPAWVAALTKTVSNGSGNDRLNHRNSSVVVNAGATKWLLVDTESKATVAHELVTSDAVLTKLEGSRG